MNLVATAAATAAKSTKTKTCSYHSSYLYKFKAVTHPSRRVVGLLGGWVLEIYEYFHGWQQR